MMAEACRQRTQNSVRLLKLMLANKQRPARDKHSDGHARAIGINIPQQRSEGVFYWYARKLERLNCLIDCLRHGN